MGAFYVSSFLLSSGDSGGYRLVRLEAVPQEQVNTPLVKEFPRLLNSLTESVCAVSMDGRILQANPAFFRMLEIGDEGKGLENIQDIYVYPEELEEKKAALEAQGFVSRKDSLLLTLGGRCRQCSDTSWIIRDPQGVPTGYICLFRDITQMKNLESRLLIAERNHGQLFDSLLVSIVLVDPEGKVLNLNGAARKMYGYTWEDVAGESYDALFSRDKNSPSIHVVMKNLNGEGSFSQDEVPRFRKDGTPFFTQSHYQVVYDMTEEVIAYTVMERDLTERIQLERELKQSLEEIKKTQSAAIMGFARLTEFRDKGTGKHLERIREYTRVMATSLKESPQYREYITEEYIENLCLSSTLHDVGKVGIEDRILLKAGVLEEDEYREIKKHALLGGEALGQVDDQLETRSFLTMGREIASYHHERWDGTGYPEGRKGENIPLSARIVAIADVYDALTSKRSYKEAMSHDQAVDLIRDERAKQFDPHLVDVFLENHLVFDRIKSFIEFESNPMDIQALMEPEKPRKGAGKKSPGGSGESF